MVSADWWCTRSICIIYYCVEWLISPLPENYWKEKFKDVKFWGLSFTRPEAVSIYLTNNTSKFQFFYYLSKFLRIFGGNLTYQLELIYKMSSLHQWLSCSWALEQTFYQWGSFFLKINLKINSFLNKIQLGIIKE